MVKGEGDNAGCDSASARGDDAVCIVVGQDGPICDQGIFEGLAFF